MGKDFRSETAEAVSRFHGSVRKAFTGYYRVKDFIRRTRATKTAHDERTLVAKESAAIRASFKDASIGPEHRFHSLGKLVYIYLMGYPALFGQVECMKLAATIGEGELRMKDKRLGYLGVTLLSDEHQETLTLVTNSLKYDLNHTNEGVVSLALSTLAMCLSPAMARELAPEIDRLLHQPTSPILRKKAAAAAIKMIQKDPELVAEGFFEDRLSGLLGDKNGSVVLGGVQLLNALLTVDGANEQRAKHTISLIRVCKSIAASPFNPERDVSGVPDPVLQVAILRVLRLLPPTEEVVDLLAILGTTLGDAGKNVANAVAFEVAKSILDLAHFAPQLQSIATEILTKFLGSTSDSNLRFVALNLLQKTRLPESTQTVLACLHDADVSIRRAAMRVSLSLATSRNINEICPQLLALVRREREDPSLARECLRELRGIVARSAHGEQLLSLLIRLLKSDKGEEVNELVNVAVKQIKREIHGGALEGILVAKELFFALTIIESAHTDESIESNSSSSLNSSLFKTEISQRPSLALLQTALWSFGQWAWEGVVGESLCTSEQLIELICAFLPGPSRGFALIALVKLAQQAEKQMIIAYLKRQRKSKDVDEALLFIELGFAIGEEEVEVESDAEISNSEESEGIDDSVIEEMSSSTVDSTVDTSNPSNCIITKLGDLRVIVDKVIPDGNALQIHFTVNSPLQVHQISIALAVSKEFDFDYLQSASTADLSPNEALTMKIVIRKRSADLLDLSEEVEDVDFSACPLRMRVQYTLTDGQTQTHLSAIPFFNLN